MRPWVWHRCPAFGKQPKKNWPQTQGWSGPQSGSMLIVARAGAAIKITPQRWRTASYSKELLIRCLLLISLGDYTWCCGVQTFSLVFLRKKQIYRSFKRGSGGCLSYYCPTLLQLLLKQLACVQKSIKYNIFTWYWWFSQMWVLLPFPQRYVGTKCLLFRSRQQPKSYHIICLQHLTKRRTLWVIKQQRRKKVKKRKLMSVQAYVVYLI